MTIASYIKEIGRGKEGARSLTQAQAYDLMSQVLDQRVTELEIGAFAIAMRIKGESIDELSGFLEAVHERCIPIRPERPTIVLPSYNGARKLPNLTALLALLLAQEGVLTELPVLPRTTDAATTAVYIQSVVSGEKPAPAPLNQQVECIRRVLAGWSHVPAKELSA